MLDLALVVQPAVLVQVLHDVVRHGLDLLAGHHGELVGVPSVLRDGAEGFDSVPLSGLVIIGSVSGCGVDESGVVVLDVIGGDDLVSPLGLGDGLEVEHGDVLETLELLSLHPLDDLELLVSALLHDELGLGLEDDHVLLLTCGLGHPDLGVVEVGVDGNGHVGCEGPRGGGPDQE